MRLSIAKTLKKGDVVAHWKTGAEIVLQKDAEHSILDRLVMLTDAFDGARYVHTEVVALKPRAPKTKPAAVYFF